MPRWIIFDVDFALGPLYLVDVGSVDVVVKVHAIFDPAEGGSMVLSRISINKLI
jgi:hypothetical protein